MNKPTAPKNAPVKTKRYLPTHAYLDVFGPFQIVAPRGTVLHTEPVPAEVLDADRDTQEAWVAEAAKAAGFKVKGRVKEYPWGFYFNV